MGPYGEAFAEFYDRFFGDYAEKAAGPLLNFFDSQPVALDYPRILDLGCGTGRLAFRFLEAGYGFTGLDLSRPMLALAEKRCARHLASGKARFLHVDMADFRVEESFGLAVSTYNAMNHLDSESRLRECFRAVLQCLSPTGFFLFDFHTLRGLEEWALPQSVEFAEGRMEAEGSFEKATGQATLRLKGTWKNQVLKEEIRNRSFSLEKLVELLRQEGFSPTLFTRIDDLGSSLPKPEQEKRVFVLTRPAGPS